MTAPATDAFTDAATDAFTDAVTVRVARARSHALGDNPRRTALRFPDKVGLVDGDVRLTYAQLDAVIDTAAALSDRGLQQGDRLALLSHNCWQFVVLVFATARLGVVLVPVNVTLGAQEVAFVLDHSGAVAFVAGDGLGAVASETVELSGVELRVRGRILLAGVGPQDWEDVRAWAEHDGAPRLSVVDRRKDMITSGGENVASREVEQCVYALDGVAELAVSAVDHPRWVEAVAAVVVPRPGAPTAEDVLTHCRQHLAGYKRPKCVVPADSLPENPSGTILGRQLRTEHAGLPDGDPACPTTRR